MRNQRQSHQRFGWALATMACLCLILASVNAFVPTTTTTTTLNRPTTSTTSSTALNMANDEDMLRWARASRSAGADDTVVELMRPLGLVLNEDAFKNVYVETVAPKGNAARAGKVRKYIDR